MANSLSQEEINFLRLAGLLIRIAPRAVRQKFDDELHPVQLQQFLLRNRRKIDDLTFKRRVITQLQYDLLYPRGKLLRYLKTPGGIVEETNMVILPVRQLYLRL